MNNTIIYSAIVFNKSNILQCIIPKFQNIYSRHTTLFFGKQSKQPFNGQTVQVKLLKEIYDNNCQTIQVEILNQEILEFYKNHNTILNRLPHITVSCNNNIKPVYSNNFFNGNIKEFKTNRFNKNIILIGIVGYYSNNNTWNFELC